MKGHKFPLPVSHTRAPLQVDRSAAWLIGAALFLVGFAAGAALFGAAIVRDTDRQLRAQWAEYSKLGDK